MESVLNVMPPYELDESKNVLLTIGQCKRLFYLSSPVINCSHLFIPGATEAAGTSTGADRSVWAVGQGEKDANREAFQRDRENSVHNNDNTTASPTAAQQQLRSVKGEGKVVPAKAASVQKVFDLLSMDDEDGGDNSGGGSSGSAVGLSASQQADVKRNLKAAQLARVASVKSTLLDTSLLTVAVSVDFRGSKGRLCLFLTNQSDYTLEHLKVTVEKVDYLTVQQQEAPVTLALGDEVCHVLMSFCVFAAVLTC